MGLNMNIVTGNTGPVTGKHRKGKSGRRWANLSGRPDAAGTVVTVKAGGKAGLIAGAVKSEENKVGTLTLDTSAELALHDGLLVGDEGYGTGVTDTSAKLVLTATGDAHGAVLAGVGKMVAGGTEIMGGNESANGLRAALRAQ